MLIAGTAAEVAGDALPNLLFAGRGIVLQQVDRGHDHARRAVAALQAVLLPEALLQRMQLPFRRETLDRRHRRAVGLHGKHRARLRAPAVDEHRARAALARVTADMGSREIEMLAQEVHEQCAWFDVRFAHLAVDRDGDLDHRGANPSPNSRLLATGYWLLSASRRRDVDTLHDQLAVVSNFLLALRFLALLPDLTCGPEGQRRNRHGWRAVDRRRPELDHLVMARRRAGHAAVEQIDALEHVDLRCLSVDLDRKVETQTVCGQFLARLR